MSVKPSYLENSSRKALNELRDECFKIADEHGWHDRPRSIGDILALLHSEVTEALEEHRVGHSPTETYYTREVFAHTVDRFNGVELKVKSEVKCSIEDSGAKPCGIPSELADLLIRVFDFCGEKGIDIESAVLEKVEYNRNRPYRHGNKAL